jgi:hypothetical protein
LTSTGELHGDLLGVRVLNEVENSALIVIAEISSNIGMRFRGTSGCQSDCVKCESKISFLEDGTDPFGF